jgi:hypothetical protein
MSNELTVTINIAPPGTPTKDDPFKMSESLAGRALALLRPAIRLAEQR